MSRNCMIAGGKNAVQAAAGWNHTFVVYEESHIHRTGLLNIGSLHSLLSSVELSLSFFSIPEPPSSLISMLQFNFSLRQLSPLFFPCLSQFRDKRECWLCVAILNWVECVHMINSSQFMTQLDLLLLYYTSPVQSHNGIVKSRGAFNTNHIRFFFKYRIYSFS